MRLENESPSSNVEDQRGQGGFANQGNYGRSFGFPGTGTGSGIPIGVGRGGFSISTIILLVVAYFAFKFIFGIDLIDVMNGGNTQQPYNGSNTEITLPRVPVGNNTN
jgi:hypothetical protein